ncbi:class I SAM-dependent methyltransferase [Streptomyces sp. NPDC048297]|uniref:class I SAM-dependent methyltransferase n=1 Tax=Streptomyces sp. NPDC048297 TaxID=3365531 RepID=UPI00371E24F0
MTSVPQVSSVTAEPHVSSELLEFYGNTIDESERLTSSADGLLELLRTQEILRRYLPSGRARVLDVGGGPGTHARWLVKDGHFVHVVDPVPRHVSHAATTGATVEIGDARNLTAPDHSYDVVLLLGPLYHLPERAERDRALAEALRVVKPGGLIAAAAVGRYATLFEHVATTRLDKEIVRDTVRERLRTGFHEPGSKGFSTVYFHTPQELAEELTQAGLDDVQLHNVEGPAWAVLKGTEQYTQGTIGNSPLFRAALEAARLADAHPALLCTASHLLAVGRAPHALT